MTTTTATLLEQKTNYIFFLSQIFIFLGRLILMAERNRDWVKKFQYDVRILAVRTLILGQDGGR